MTIESIVRKHMEAMHDELLQWLRGPQAQNDSPYGFAEEVIFHIDKGTMYSSEYAGWYKEEAD